MRIMTSVAMSGAVQVKLQARALPPWLVASPARIWLFSPAPSTPAVAEALKPPPPVGVPLTEASHSIVAPGATELELTLAWDDPSGVPNTGAALVNDLDLLVTDAAGTAYYPWTLDPANPADDAVRSGRDATNNLEQVRIDAPAAGGSA